MNPVRRTSTSRWPAVLTSLIIPITLSACSSADPGNAAAQVIISEVEDIGVVDQGANLRGRDGGYSGLHNGRSVWVFGDSVTETANVNGQNWFSSTWSTSADTNASDGIDQLEMGVNPLTAEPVELLPYTAEEQQFNDLHADGADCVEPCGARWAIWPGPLVGDPMRNRSLLFYQKISAQTGELNFFSVGRGLAVWPYDADRPMRPVINAQATYPTLMDFPDNLQPGAAALVENDVLYAFACRRESNDRVCYLARAPLANALEAAQWEYATGLNSWSNASSQAAALFFGADIMAVAFNAYLGRYIAVYSEPTSRVIQLRSAPSLTGPWSVPTRVLTTLPSANTNGWVYDGLTHSQYNEEGGRVIYLTYTRDPGTDWFAREMRLVRVTLELQ